MKKIAMLRRRFGCALVAATISAMTPIVGRSVEVEAVSRFDYDSYGHLTTLESPFGGERRYEHNFQGQDSAVRFNGGIVISDTVYGAHGRPEQFRYGSDINSEARTARFVYDALERLTHMTLETDGLGGFDYQATDMTYDERGFLRGQRREDRAVGAATVRYDYSAQGQLTRFDWNGSRIDYYYDPRGNLIGRGEALGVPALAPDLDYGLDNRRADWTYDDAGRVLVDDKNRYEYDARGRVRLVRDRATGTWKAHYLYDASGRRVRVLEPDRVTYSYRDATGAVIAEDVRDRALEPEVFREHVLFGGRKVMQATFRENQQAEVERQFTDRLGNPAVAWGTVGSRAHEYSPFGLALAVGATTPHEGAHGFTGHEDDGTGLIYMQARYYGPDTGRFYRPDPARDFDLHLPSSVNLYQYAYANPIAYFDRLGLAAEVGGFWDNMNWAFRDAVRNPPPYARNLRKAGFGLLMTALGLKAISSGVAGVNLAYANYIATGARGGSIAYTTLTTSVNTAMTELLLGLGSVGYGSLRMGEGALGGGEQNVSLVRSGLIALGVSPDLAARAETHLDAFVNGVFASKWAAVIIYLLEYAATDYDPEVEILGPTPGVEIEYLDFEYLDEEPVEPPKK